VEGEERILEDGKGVGLSDGEVNGESGGRYEPAAVARGSDRTVSIKETQGHVVCSWEEVDTAIVTDLQLTLL